MRPEDPPERPSVEDEWLELRRAGEGDEEAFARLVERHHGRLLRLCHGLLGDGEDARDAVQEVFVRVYRQAGRARPVGRIYTWMYRIAVNYCLNRLRRRRIVSFLPLPLPGEGSWREPVDPAPDPDRGIDARRRWQSLLRRLEKLPPGQRAVVVLARFEGLSYREIAATLGVSISAVESRLFRAMRTLEKSLEGPEA